MTGHGRSVGHAMPDDRLSWVYYGWRRAITILCFVVYASIGLILAALTLPVAYGRCPVPVTVQRRVRYGIHVLCRFLLWFLSTTGCSQLCVRPDRDWIPKKSQGGRILCANHPTYLDIVVLLSLVPDALCIVKSATLKWPWSRSFVRLAGYISNAHAEEALRVCSERLAQGNSLIVFPEGTRSPVNAINPFQRGLANLLLRSEAELVTILLACQPLSLGKQQAWHQVPLQPYVLYVHVLPPIKENDWLMASRRSTQPIQVRVRELNRQLKLHFEEKLSAYGYLRNED